MDNDKKTKIDKEYGRVFHEIRKSKGYTQHEIEDSTVSAASISRFEHGLTMLGTDSFLKILRNIGVTSSEYESIFQKLSTQHDPMPLQNAQILAKALETRNISLLESLLTKVRQEIKNRPYQKKYQFDRILVEIVLTKLDSSRVISRKDIRFLTDFLLKVKHWGRYETFLLSWAVEIFNTETLEQLFMQMIIKSNYNTLSNIDKKSVLDTALNVLDSFLVRKELPAAKEVIFQLENLEITAQLLYEKMELKYDKARFNFLSDLLPDLAKDEMWYYYDVLKYAGAFELANIVREEIQDLTEENEEKK
ncbi:Rgg/GadR/MutR family transcriptional regulator [Lactovum odontotermitis]